MRSLVFVAAVAACSGSPKPPPAAPSTSADSATPPAASPTRPPVPAAQPAVPVTEIPPTEQPAEPTIVEHGTGIKGNTALHEGGSFVDLTGGSLSAGFEGQPPSKNGPRSHDVPSAKFGEVVAKGGIDRAIIRRYLKRHIQHLLYCYEKQLLAKPGIAGTLTLKFTIDDQGRVENASTSTGLDTEVESCVTDVARSIEYPKPINGASVTVTAPLKLAPR